MDLLRQSKRSSLRRSFLRHCDNSEADEDDLAYTYGDEDVEVYASVPLFEDAPSPSFPVTLGETDLAKTLGVRGEICTAVFSPHVFALVRKSSVVFQAPYSSIKSYGLRKNALYIEFGRVESHGEGGELTMETKYNKAMKECLHVNTEHKKREEKDK